MKIYNDRFSGLKLVCCLFILCGIVHVCQGQGIPLVDIKAATRDSSSKYYYPRLLEEFISQPEYYSTEKGTYLYYGRLYSSYYKIFDLGKNVIQFDQSVNKMRLKKAIPLGEKILEENPVNLDVLVKLGYCYEKEGQPEKASLMKNRAAVLLRAIESVSTGLSREQAFKVTSVHDEYLLIGKSGLKGSRLRSEMHDQSVIDVWEIKDAKSKVMRSVYFEVLYNHDAIPK